MSAAAKECPTCGASDRHRDGRCRPCRQAAAKRARDRNPGYRREYQARWRKSDPGREKSYRLKSRYGITQERFDEMLLEQGGVCAICSQPETALHNTGQVRRLSVDHCHETGAVRGLLCHRCNLVLGRVEDATAILDAAAVYLRRAAS